MKKPTSQILLEAKILRSKNLNEVQQLGDKIGTPDWTAQAQSDFEVRTSELKLSEQAVDAATDLLALEVRQSTWNDSSITPVAILNSSNQDSKAGERFMLSMLLREMSTGKGLKGFYQEMNTEGISEARDAGAEISPGQFTAMIPAFVGTQQKPLTRMTDVPFSKRDSTVGSSGGGGHTVQTDLGDLIPFLDPTQLLRQLGVTFLTNLKGHLDLPRKITRFPSGALAEQGTAGEGNTTFDVLSLRPKRQGVYVEATIQLLMQSNSSIENMLRSDLRMAVEELMELHAFNGSGSSNQPTGILSTVGIGNVVGGTNGALPDWSDITALELALFAAKAGRGKMAYATTPGIANVLKNGKRDIAGNGFIWEGPNGQGEINGYPAYTSTLIPSTLTKGSTTALCHAVVMGAWNQLVVAQWGGIEITVNPYSLDTIGTIRYTVNSFYDIGVRHPQAFAAMLDATLS